MSEKYTREPSLEKYDRYTPNGDVVDDFDLEKGSTDSPAYVSPPPNGQLSKDDTITKVLEVNGFHRHKEKAGPGHTDAERVEYISEITAAGEKKFHKLTWFQLVIVLVVTAVALGTLSMPTVFATLGMAGGVITTIFFGLMAVYTSYVIGQVKLKYPQVHHYSDVGRLLLPGRAGVILSRCLEVIFVFFIILGIGSHFLTGKMAFATIVDDTSVCSLVWSVVTLVLLFICAMPPSFAEMAVLGYVDFLSIMSAVFVTLIASGIDAHAKGWNTGWQGGAAENVTFAKGMLAVCNVLFAYAFSIGQFTYMEEMARPEDFPKAVGVLGCVMITIYTCVGALGYAFIGPGVKGPALLSAGHTISRVAFGLALPVIFISGAILVTTDGRFIMDKLFKNNIVRYVNTPRGWAVWICVVFTLVLCSWIIAEVIPVFNPLLGITAALFNSAFTLYLPGIMWFKLIREGGPFSSGRNIALSILNMFIICVGLTILGAGTYASIQDIIDSYRGKSVGKPFSCKA